MTSLADIYATYGFSHKEVLPMHLIAAHLNTLEMKVQKPPPSNWRALWNKRHSKLKAAGKTQRTQRRVSFGTAQYHSIDKPAVPIATSDLSDKICREIISAPVVEHKIVPLLAMHGAINYASTWQKYIAGTPARLAAELKKHNISREEFAQDMKRIMSYHVNNNTAIIGYKSGGKLPAAYKEYTSTRPPRPTGKTFSFYPKFRRYMIKVVQDPDTAARRLQDFLSKN
tara:strand:+ start:385 stop:1065 length:681 start_codon:yes stop_codon:yes gene_type:complete